MTFWDYLTGIPIETKVILVLIALYLVYKGIAVIPWIKWPREKKKEKCTPNSHKECGLYAEYLKMREHIIEIAQAPEKLVRNQMYYVDLLEDTMRNMLYKHFLKLIVIKYGDGVDATKHPDTEDYLRAVNYSLIQMKSKIRFYIRENHIDTLDDMAFMEKINNRISLTLDMLTNEMNDAHPNCLSMTRGEVYKHNASLDEEFRKLMYEMWVQARVLAIESKERIRQLAKMEETGEY